MNGSGRRRPAKAFLLVACLGLLLGGCLGPAGDGASEDAADLDAVQDAQAAWNRSWSTDLHWTANVRVPGVLSFAMDDFVRFEVRVPNGTSLLEARIEDAQMLDPGGPSAGSVSILVTRAPDDRDVEEHGGLLEAPSPAEGVWCLQVRGDPVAANMQVSFHVEAHGSGGEPDRFRAEPEIGGPGTC